MNLTYSLKITGLEKRPADGAILKIFWTKTATNENGIFADFKAWTIFSSISEGENFIPFQTLTEEIVKTWIMEDPQYEGCNFALEARIEKAIVQPELLGENQFPWIPQIPPIVEGDITSIGPKE